MDKHFTVSDGKIVLFLWPAEEGGYTITSPLDDRLISEAETLEEAFIMGHDAMELLRKPGPGKGTARTKSTTRRRGAPRATRSS